MSTIIVRPKKSVNSLIDTHKQELKNSFIDSTATVFDIKPSAVIVEFQTYDDPEPENAPDLLIRAETSVKRRYLLKDWAKSLLNAWKIFIKDRNLSLPENFRIAVKPYVIDSEWIEDSA